MKPSKLDKPAIKEKVVQHLAAGQSQGSIANQFGVNQSSISRFAKRQDIKALIEQEQMRLLEAVPDAVDNIKTLVKEFKDIPKDDTKRQELAYKASKDVLKSVGIMPTPIQSQMFVNLYQDNRAIISPCIKALFDAHMDKITALDDEDLENMAEQSS